MTGFAQRHQVTEVLPTEVFIGPVMQMDVVHSAAGCADFGMPGEVAPAYGKPFAAPHVAGVVDRSH